MANVIKGLMERGLARMHALLGEPTWLYHGTSFNCIPSTARRGTVLEVGGFQEVVELTLIVRKQDMPTDLTVDSTIIRVDSTDITADATTGYSGHAPGQKASQNGVAYRVIAVRNPATDSHWEIDLTSPHK